MWASLSNYRDGALLFLRVALGSFYIKMHGWWLLIGGVKEWKHTGLAMKHVGIAFAPGFWGFIAAFAATLGVALLILGLFFRPACLVIFLTLTITALIGLDTVGLGKSAHSFEFAILTLSLLFIGPGKYSFDKG